MTVTTETFIAMIIMRTFSVATDISILCLLQNWYTPVTALSRVLVVQILFSSIFLRQNTIAHFSSVCVSYNRILVRIFSPLFSPLSPSFWRSDVSILFGFRASIINLPFEKLSSPAAGQSCGFEQNEGAKRERRSKNEGSGHLGSSSFTVLNSFI